MDANIRNQEEENMKKEYFQKEVKKGDHSKRMKNIAAMFYIKKLIFWIVSARRK